MTKKKIEKPEEPPKIEEDDDEIICVCEEDESDIELKKIAKIIKIHTLNVQVEIQTEDEKDTLKGIKKLAEEIIDKYSGAEKIDKNC